MVVKLTFRPVANLMHHPLDKNVQTLQKSKAKPICSRIPRYFIVQIIFSLSFDFEILLFPINLDILDLRLNFLEDIQSDNPKYFKNSS